MGHKCTGCGNDIGEEAMYEYESEEGVFCRQCWFNCEGEKPAPEEESNPCPICAGPVGDGFVPCAKCVRRLTKVEPEKKPGPAVCRGCGLVPACNDSGYCDDCDDSAYAATKKPDEAKVICNICERRLKPEEQRNCDGKIYCSDCYADLGAVPSVDLAVLMVGEEPAEFEGITVILPGKVTARQQVTLTLDAGGPIRIIQNPKQWI